MPVSNPTPWKKSRTFGDKFGGRLRRRMTDNIFRRLHSLQQPGPQDHLPILIEDNPSRDFFFPISASEAAQALAELDNFVPGEITHIWLRRDNRKDSASEARPFAEFICGRTVRVIILYPWRKDLSRYLGSKKPDQKTQKTYAKFGAEIFESSNECYVRFSETSLRRFYIEHLLFHEFAHHLDWYRRHWSKANRKQVEEFANQYAVAWSSTATEILNNLDNVPST